MGNPFISYTTTNGSEAVHRIGWGLQEKCRAADGARQAPRPFCWILTAQHILRGWAAPGLANREAASAAPGPRKLGETGPEQEAAAPYFPTSHSGTF